MQKVLSEPEATELLSTFFQYKNMDAMKERAGEDKQLLSRLSWLKTRYLIDLDTKRKGLGHKRKFTTSMLQEALFYAGYKTEIMLSVSDEL